MKLPLECEGKENPDLIRSMFDLVDGCSLLYKTCGILTGSSCLLSLYAMEKPGDETPSEALLLMLKELKGWFEEAIEGK